MATEISIGLFVWENIKNGKIFDKSVQTTLSNSVIAGSFHCCGFLLELSASQAHQQFDSKHGGSSSSPVEDRIRKYQLISFTYEVRGYEELTSNLSSLAL